MLKHLIKNKYINNSIWTFIEKIVHLINAFIIGILIARYFGSEKFGVYSYVQSFVAMFIFIVGLGLDSIVVREIVKNPKKSERIISSAFFIKIIATFFSIIALNSISFLFNDDNLIRLLIFIFSISLFYHCFYVFVCYFQSIVNIKFISIGIIVYELISIVLKLIFLKLNLDLIAFITLDSLLYLFLSFFFLIYYSKKNKLLLFPDFSIIKKMLKDSWPLMLSSGAIMLYMKFDQIMIKEMLSMDQLGYYAVSVRISEAWYFIPMIIGTVFFPSILKSQQNLKKYHNRLSELFFYGIWISIFFMVIIFLSSEFIILTFFGEEYIDSISSLKILVFSGMFVSMGYVNGKWMVAENYTLLSLYRNLLGFLINIILNLILIPSFGIEGAALSTVLSILFASNLFFLVQKKTRTIFLIQNMAVFRFSLIKNNFKSILSK